MSLCLVLYINSYKKRFFYLSKLTSGDEPYEGKQCNFHCFLSVVKYVFKSVVLHSFFVHFKLVVWGFPLISTSNPFAAIAIFLHCYWVLMFFNFRPKWFNTFCPFGLHRTSVLKKVKTWSQSSSSVQFKFKFIESFGSRIKNNIIGVSESVWIIKQRYNTKNIYVVEKCWHRILGFLHKLLVLTP